MSRKVYIVDTSYEYDKLFSDEGYELVEHIEDAELVCFTGGEDVDPTLYGEPRHRTTHCNIIRDMQEQRIYRKALQLEIPMVGICRGGQFLNVMCGGKMYQHVTAHGVFNGHRLYDQLDGDVLEVTSTHHQMMKPSDKALVIAIAIEGGTNTSYSKEHSDFVTALSLKDYEVVLYEQENCLCFQPHPEFSNDKWDNMRNYFFRCINNYLF